MRALIAKLKPIAPASRATHLRPLSTTSPTLDDDDDKERNDPTRLKKKKKKKSNPILGTYIPDVWTLPGSTVPDAVPAVPLQSPVSQPKETSELIPYVIDGIQVSKSIRSEIAQEVHVMKKTLGKLPGLAVVLVGNRRDSESYVRFKIKACQEVGITSLLAKLPEDCPENEVIKAVSSFNSNPSVHGILVQLPLPQHMNEEKILNCISLEKDVDGFHPLNMGNLALGGREPLFIPCASKACMELLLRSGVELKGKNVVVVGRSKVVGLPISLLLQRHHATVTVVHALTNNPENITREADILISAAGVANLVRGNWLKKGAIVIDVGTNPIEDPCEEHGYRLTGDVCYEEALQVASMITPVPGGVGPVTIAMLLSSTLESAKRIYGME